MSPDTERRARVALTFLAKPGDPVLGCALRTRSAGELLALVTGAAADGDAMLTGQLEDAALGRAIERWRAGRTQGCARSCRATASGRLSSMTLATPGRCCYGCALPQTCV